MGANGKTELRQYVHLFLFESEGLVVRSWVDRSVGDF